MVGYVGLEALVNRSFAKVIEQTAASEVVVRKGDGTHSEDVDPEDRQLNACDGYEQAVKLAKVTKAKQRSRNKTKALALFYHTNEPEKNSPSKTNRPHYGFVILFYFQIGKYRALGQDSLQTREAATGATRGQERHIDHLVPRVHGDPALSSPPPQHPTATTAATSRHYSGKGSLLLLRRDVVGPHKPD